MKSLEIANERLTLSFNCELGETSLSEGFEKNLKEACGILEYFLIAEDQEVGGLYDTDTPFALTVELCDDERMQELNREYRDKDKTTDVLSFPLFEDLRGGEEYLIGEAELGDIFISAPVMEKQALEFEISPEQEFFHLMVHGFLHLCGYDHEINEDEEWLMEKLEKKLVDQIYKKIY